MTIILFIIYVGLASSGMLLFKLGSQANNLVLGASSSGFNFSVSWMSLLGICCYMGSFLLWLYILTKVKLTWAMPLSVGLINVVIFIGSALLLKEQIGLMQIIGIVVIVIGLALISLTGSR